MLSRPEVHLLMFNPNRRIIKTVRNHAGDVIVWDLNDSSDGLYFVQIINKRKFS